MAANPSIFCGPCDFKHLSVPAAFWCPICNEGTCASCNEQHCAFALTRQHEVIDIENYKKLPEFLLSLERTCAVHDNKLDFYCQTHNESCCLTCIPEKHKECPNVTAIEVVVKNAKFSPAFADMLQGWDDLLHNVTEFITLKKYNLKEIEHSMVAIQKEMASFRQEINELLDRLEAQALHKLENIFSKVMTAEKNAIDEMSSKKSEVQLYQQQCKNVQDFASDRQTFLAIQHISLILSDEERKFASKIKNCNSQNIKFETNETLRSLDNKLKDFGTFRTSRINLNFKLSQRKAEQAQFMPLAKVHQVDIHKIKMRLTKSFSLPSGRYALHIKDCAILPDGRFVFTDFSASMRLLIFEPVSSHFDTITLPLAACGITSIEGSTVAVLFGEENEMKIIQLTNSGSYSEETTITLPDRGWSLSCSERKIAVSVKNKGIILMNIAGKQINLIPIKCDYPINVHLDQDKLYYTNSLHHTIHCCTITGHSVWERHISDERNQYSLTTDDNGVVYVLCSQSADLVIITADGQDSATFKVKTKDDGIDLPRVLTFDRNKKQLLWVSCNGEANLIALSP